MAKSWNGFQATVSIQLMSPASGDYKPSGGQNNEISRRFHSINVPSEWGLRSSLSILHLNKNAFKWLVSIQLMSPASGDTQPVQVQSKRIDVSIQLMSPASGDIGLNKQP